VAARAGADGGPADFVGRELELGRLGDRLEWALGGAGGLVVVTGEAGIGKTRMLREFAEAARGRGALTLWGSSFEGEWHPPYGLWAEALAVGVRANDPEWRPRVTGRDAAVLARLLPGLDAAPGAVPPVASLSPEEERFRLFDAVARLLVAAAARRPVVLVLDDLHWTDRDSLQLLTYCGRFVGRAALLLVGAYRDGPPDLHAGHPLVDTIAGLCREPGYERIALGGLTPDEVADYLARATGRRPSPALTRAVHAETGGNPFYVRQLWRHLVDERVVVERDGAWALAAGVGDAGVPHGVRHVVARRLARLSGTASAVLRAAAALTAGFDFPILRTITDLPEEALLGCLDEAVDAGLLHLVERPLGRYDFVHPIVRHTLYDELNPDRRARLHRRLAEALEHAQATRTVDAAAEIAAQYAASAALPGADRGVEYALLGAEGATASSAHERAVMLLRIAADLAGSRPAAVRAEVWCRLAFAEADALLLDEAERSVTMALDALAEAGAEPRAVAEFLAGAIRRLRDGGAPPEACERFVDRGLALLGGVRDLTWARLMLLRDRFETVSTGAVSATRWLGYDPDAVALARSAGDEDDHAHTLEPFDWRSREETEAILDLARRWRRPAAVIRALNVACRDALFLHGAFTDALAAGEELLAATRRYGSLPGEAEAVVAIAAAHRARSELSLARQSAAQAHELVARLHPAHRLHVIVAVPLAIMLAYYLEEDADGDWPALARRAAARASAPAVGRRGLLGLHVGACAALASARAGDRASADRLLDALLGVLGRMEPTMHHHTLAVHYVAITVWELVDPARAPAVRRLVDGLVEAGAGDSLMASHSLCLARMSALAGDLPRAAREFGQARRDLDASGHRPLRAIADHDEALTLVRAGSSDAARIGSLLAAALAAFRALGMAGFERRATALREASRPPAPGPGQPEGDGRLPGGLTSREAEVLGLICAGSTTRQMAEALIVSRATVERHITSIYRKIGARSRADATAFALRHGVAGGVADRGRG
jgi:DNA-binding CsgD family transcriptional regulator